MNASCRMMIYLSNGRPARVAVFASALLLLLLGGDGLLNQGSGRSALAQEVTCCVCIASFQCVDPIAGSCEQSGCTDGEVGTVCNNPGVLGSECVPLGGDIAPAPAVGPGGYALAITVLLLIGTLALVRSRLAEPR